MAKRSERWPRGSEPDPGTVCDAGEHTINAAIDQAVAEAEAQGVIGKESTPFLLARVAELTGGDSLKSNIQLVFNNAILASEIAKEYQRLAG